MTTTNDPNTIYCLKEIQDGRGEGLKGKQPVHPFQGRRATCSGECTDGEDV